MDLSNDQVFPIRQSILNFTLPSFPIKIFGVQLISIQKSKWLTDDNVRMMKVFLLKMMF